MILYDRRSCLGYRCTIDNGDTEIEQQDETGDVNIETQ